MEAKRGEGAIGERRRSTAAGDLSTAAARWLEDRVPKSSGVHARSNRVPFDSVALYGLSVTHAAGGRLLCSFRVPSHLTVINYY